MSLTDDFIKFEKRGVGSKDSLEAFITVGSNDQIYLSVGFMEIVNDNIDFNPSHVNLYFSEERNELGIEFLNSSKEDAYILHNSSKSNNRVISGQAIKERYQIKKQRYYEIDVRNNFASIKIKTN